MSDANQSAPDAVIEERENGPLVVKGVPRLTVSDAENEPKPVMALCRCGASQNKPFCDGTHSKIGFTSAADDDIKGDKLRAYTGEHVTVYYNQLLCSHAAECGKRLPEAFNPKNRPWITPDNGSIEAIRDVVAACPSGALSWSQPDDAPEHLLAETPGITVEKNGPYRVTGLHIADGRLAEGATAEKFVLCRCGASKNKPYCDGSHRDIGWKD